jgi:superfamily II DNA/RNA helicase
MSREHQQQHKRKMKYLMIILTISQALPATDAFQGRPSSSRIAVTATSLASEKRQASSQGRKRKGPRFTQTVHEEVSKVREYNPDRMWRNSKSIEQLEDRLASRWGTDLNTWTAKDHDDDEEEVWDDPTTKVKGDVPKFRARRVLDPWQKSEGVASKDPVVSGVSSKLERRAQLNQQRLRKEENRAKQTDKSTTEYYDEEDVGYEPERTRFSKNDFVVDDLIAPKPAGGVGTFNKEDSSGGFFFRKLSTESSISIDGTADKGGVKRKERQEKTPAVSLLDENGKPLFLTLKQAENNFEESLRSLGVDPSDYYKETQDLTNRYVANDSQSWEDLGISSPIILRNLEKMGCARPLAVQTNSCSWIIQGKDVIVGTYTGSGKTLAFLVPLAQKLLDDSSSLDKSLQTIIVAPGRELASQIVSVARQLLEGTEITCMLSIGGTTFSRNLEQIRKNKPAVLVGTPGRLAELIVGRPGEKTGRLKISKVCSLVLDECDALLEYKAHRDPTAALVQRLKQNQGDALQSVLCSATASDLVGSSKLQNYLRDDYATARADSNDVMVTSGIGNKANGEGTRVSRTVIHGVVHVPHRRFSLDYLRKILHTDPIPQQILIFVENSRKVKIVVEKLEEIGIIAAPLHGGVGSEKSDRSEVSKALREGYVGIVVATELAARGLDAPLLTHVINMDLPTDASHYAHRAGRCGRGGRPGVVINMTTNPQERKVPQKFADSLAIQMWSVEPRNGKLAIVDASTRDLD